MSDKTIATGRFIVRSNKSFTDYEARLKKLKTGRDPDIKLIEEIYNPIEIRKSAVAVASDWHGRCHDPILKKALFLTADEYKIDTLLVPGDFFDNDAYTPFPKKHHEVTFRHELKTMEKLLGELTSHFKKVYFCVGNHEARWLKHNEGNMDIADMFSVTGITKGYETTMDDHFILHSSGTDWRVCHPAEFSRTFGKVPKTLADRYQMSIFAAHGHRLGWCLDDTGRFQCVEGGGMFDQVKIEYLRRTSTFPGTSAGFWLIMDGWANCFPKRLK